MKKHTILILILLVAVLETKSQVAFEWATNIGGLSSDYGYSIACDNVGNIYVSGAFLGNADFDPGLDEYNLSSNGSNDCFVVKLNDQGNLIWAISFGGIGYDIPMKLVIDNNNNILLTGIFEDMVDFDPGVGTYEISSNGNDDFYVLKLDSDANLIWAHGIGGGSYEDWANSMCTDDSGDIYITGQFKGTADFDPGPGVENLSSTIGGWDAFILKLTSEGNFVWAKSIGSTSYDIGWEIVTDTAKNVIINGTFEGTVDFNPGAGVNTSTCIGTYDIFTLKLDSLGNYRWHNHLGSFGPDESRALAVDTTGNIYLAGIIANQADFNPGDEMLLIPTNGGSDIFVQKLDTLGNLVWVKTFGGTSDDGSYELVLDNNDNILVTGFFRNTIYLPNYELISQGATDAVAIKLNNDGDLKWIKAFGGTSNDCGYAIIDLNDENPVITGAFSSSADFNPGTGIETIYATGSDDCFIVKLGPCSPTQSTQVETACDEFIWIDGNTYTSSNNTATYSYYNVESNGCDSIVFLDLTIISLDESVSQTGVILTANQTEAEYQWLDCNDGLSEIIGENSQTFTATANGSYAVEITSGECSVISDCFEITSVEITSEKTKSSMIYPNPILNELTIELNSQQNNMQIEILNSSGQLMFQNNVNKKLAINTSDWASGIYILKFDNGNSLKIIKLSNE